ncbi:MAG TPA: dihydrolipoamide acetyltransferase family protein [Gammaproteobacteria bacterium]|nr:dihydrolipoamide acetyltransferase family protein [Gammaproteobacteria bacterium]
MSAERAIRLPKLGLTMTEGTLVEWLVRPGQAVHAGDLLYVCETEKIANEIAADEAGTIGELLVQPGETVEVGTALATWAGSPLAGVPAAASKAAPMVPAAPAPAPPAAPASAAPARDGRLLATPHARKLARARGVDLALVAGTGPKGRIKACDVPTAPTIPAPRAAQPAPAIASGAAQPVALTAAQRTVAARMAQSKREIPHFYLEAAAEVGKLLELHRQAKARAGCEMLTLTHWIVQAVGLTLEAEPLFRRVWQDDGAVELADSDVALAAATDKGLYVGVARRVGRHPLVHNAQALAELTQRARSGRLTAQDSGGGAICVSNLGGTRVRHVFPIVLPGQASILGVGRTEAVFRPDAAGQPALRQELNLVLACDHRVLNGMDGARLLDAIVARLEDPLSLLLVAR